MTIPSTPAIRFSNRPSSPVEYADTFVNMMFFMPEHDDSHHSWMHCDSRQ